METLRIPETDDPNVLLGIGGESEAPTYAELYSGEWVHPTTAKKAG